MQQENAKLDQELTIEVRDSEGNIKAVRFVKNGEELICWSRKDYTWESPTPRAQL